MIEPLAVLGLVQGQEPPDLRRVLGGLLQLAILFFLFGLPILRAILGRKQEEARRGGPRGLERLDPDDLDRERQERRQLEEEGGDLWKQLMEGARRAEEEARAEAARTEPMPREAMPTETPGPVVARVERQVAPAPAPRPAPVSRRVRRDIVPPAETPREAAPLGAEFASASRSADRGLTDLRGISGAPLAPSDLGGPVPSEHLRGIGNEPERLGRFARERSIAGPGAGTASRALGPASDWRRAYLMAEVLAPPVSLRQGDDPLAPPGLRAL